MNKTTGMVKYDAMCRSIEECHRVDEAKDIRDQAKALEVYAREAKNWDAENKAIEIRIRAERRTGELLKVARKKGQAHKKGGAGGHNKKHMSKGATFAPAKLSEIGITRDQSSDWQKLAEIPNDEFDTALSAAGRGGHPTTEGVLIATGQKLQPKIHCDTNALKAYGHIREFEKIMAKPASQLFERMQDFQQEHVRELLPKVILWLKEMC